MTVKEAFDSIVEGGIANGAGDFVDPEALNVAAVVLAKKIRGLLVEVVRCKDCKFYDGQDELADIAGWTDGEPYCFCEEMMEYVPRKGFCHKGERKDNDRERSN